MIRSRASCCSIATILACVTGDLGAQVTNPPCAVRGRELVAAINGGDATLRVFITTVFAKPFLDFAPMDQHLRALGSVRGGGASDSAIVETLQPIARTECRLVLRSGASAQRTAMRVTVESTEPHRIAGIGIGTAAPTVALDDMSDAGIARALGAWLDRMCQNDGFSGTMLVARDGNALFQRACGFANRADSVPMRLDTKLNLGSMNKMFTAVAIAQLVEDGKLAFTDPVGKHLPDYPNPDVATKVRIHHLLTHTSGLGSYFNDEFMNASRTRFRTVREFMTLVEKEKLAFEPGTRWQYSNSGFMLLGAIVERVSGKSYFDFVRERIFQPAAMINTDSYEMDDAVPNLAIGYVRDRAEPTRWRNNLYLHVVKGGPAGGGFSTVEDLTRFAEALRAGKLVQHSTWATLTSPKPELNSLSYGYGFQLYADGDVVGHGGGFPGISAQLFIYMKGGHTIAALSNYGASATTLADQARSLLYRAQSATRR